MNTTRALAMRTRSGFYALLAAALCSTTFPTGCGAPAATSRLDRFGARLPALTAQRMRRAATARATARLSALAVPGRRASSVNPRGVDRLGGGWPATHRVSFREGFEAPSTRWFGDTVALSDLGDETLNTRGAASMRTRPRRVPLPGFWDTVRRDLNEWPAVFWQDTKDVFTNRTNLLILGTTYGAALALQETGPDRTVENSFRTHSTFKSDFRDGLGVLGNPGTHFGLAGLWYLIGQQSQNTKTYDVGTKLFRALAVTGVATLLGQTATWDESPNGEWGTFPSGHTSSTFAFASVMHREYGPAVGIPLYAAGVLVAMGRLEDREHDFSDVVMGGVMGLVMGHTIANDGRPIELFGGQIVPYVDPPAGASGLAWVRHFK